VIAICSAQPRAILSSAQVICSLAKCPLEADLSARKTQLAEEHGWTPAYFEVHDFPKAEQPRPSD
jgi:hypothetical protein